MSKTPKFKFGDRVWFDINESPIHGKIVLVDAYGNLFGDDDTVHYDIFCYDDHCTYEHIPEDYVHKYKRR